MKGISPLIATIILIALTIAIAGILGLWAASYVSTRTEEMNKTSRTIDCSLINFDVMSCRKENNVIKIILFNNRPLDIRGFTLSFFELDENVTIINVNSTTIDKILRPSSYEIVESPILLENFSKIEIRSTECPNAKKEVECK